MCAPAAADDGHCTCYAHVAGEDNLDPTLFLAFARFEEDCKEHERARAIYTLALAKIPKAECEELYNAFTKYEKKYGDRSRVEDVIVNKRKYMYEEEVRMRLCVTV